MEGYAVGYAGAPNYAAPARGMPLPADYTGSGVALAGMPVGDGLRRIQYATHAEVAGVPGEAGVIRQMTVQYVAVAERGAQQLLRLVARPIQIDSLEMAYRVQEVISDRVTLSVREEGGSADTVGVSVDYSTHEIIRRGARAQLTREVMRNPAKAFPVIEMFLNIFAEATVRTMVLDWARKVLSMPKVQRPFTAVPPRRIDEAVIKSHSLVGQAQRGPGGALAVFNQLMQALDASGASGNRVVIFPPEIEQERLGGTIDPRISWAPSVDPDLVRKEIQGEIPMLRGAMVYTAPTFSLGRGTFTNHPVTATSGPLGTFNVMGFSSELFSRPSEAFAGYRDIEIPVYGTKCSWQRVDFYDALACSGIFPSAAGLAALGDVDGSRDQARQGCTTIYTMWARMLDAILAQHITDKAGNNENNTTQSRNALERVILGANGGVAARQFDVAAGGGGRTADAMAGGATANAHVDLTSIFVDRTLAQLGESRGALTAPAAGVVGGARAGGMGGATNVINREVVAGDLGYFNFDTGTYAGHLVAGEQGSTAKGVVYQGIGAIGENGVADDAKAETFFGDLCIETLIRGMRGVGLGGYIQDKEVDFFMRQLVDAGFADVVDMSDSVILRQALAARRAHLRELYGRWRSTRVNWDEYVRSMQPRNTMCIGNLVPVGTRTYLLKGALRNPVAPFTLETLQLFRSNNILLSPLEVWLSRPHTTFEFGATVLQQIGDEVCFTATEAPDLRKFADGNLGQGGYAWDIRCGTIPLRPDLIAVHPTSTMTQCTGGGGVSFVIPSDGAEHLVAAGSVFSTAIPVTRRRIDVPAGDIYAIVVPNTGMGRRIDAFSMVGDWGVPEGGRMSADVETQYMNMSMVQHLFPLWRKETTEPSQMGEIGLYMSGARITTHVVRGTQRNYTHNRDLVTDTGVAFNTNFIDGVAVSAMIHQSPTALRR